MQLLSQSYLGRRSARLPNYPAVTKSEAHVEYPTTGSYCVRVAWPPPPWQEEDLTSTSFLVPVGTSLPPCQAGYLACSCQPPLKLEACRVRQGCEKLEHGELLKETHQLLWLCPSSLFHHSDVALRMSGPDRKGKALCFPAGKEQSSWLYAILCLSTTIML